MSERINLGPLPEVAKSHTQESESIKALQDMLPTDKFIIRFLLERDYGVDLQVEARYEKYVTNFFTHIQMKSKEKSDPNLDGSVSLSVENSNLNYLLNGPCGCSLYILYLKDRKELRYVWASEEFARIKSEDPKWPNGSTTITLKFYDKIDSRAIQSIHEKIISKQTLYRDLTEQLAKKVLGRGKQEEIPKLVLDVMHNRVRDPNITLSLLRKNGIDLVSLGYASSVLELAREIPSQFLEQDKKAQLVAAYAHYLQGSFFHAEGYLASCLENEEALNSEDEYLLNTIRNRCGVQLGKISQEEFLKREEAEIRNLTEPLLKLQAELDLVRLKASDAFRAPVTSGLREKCNQLLESAKKMGSSTLKSQAEIALLEIEGQIFLRDFTENVWNTSGLIRDSYVDLRDKVIPFINTQLESWIIRVLSLCKSIEPNPVLVADGLLTGSKILFGYIFHSKVLTVGLGIRLEINISVIERFLLLLEQISEKLLTQGMKYDAVKAKHFVTEILWCLGQQDQAKKKANQLLPRTIQYPSIADRLQKIVDGKTEVEEIEALQLSFEEDDFFLQLDDERLKEYSNWVARQLDVPLYFVEREALIQRTIARERNNWCRHIDISPEHQNFLACYCAKTRQSTKIPAEHVETVISTFKGIACHQCSYQERKPKPQMPRTATTE